MNQTKYSPWGKVQTWEEITPGIVRITTASHGGYKLDRRHNALVHKTWQRTGGYYEEDCDGAIVVLTFPHFFSADAREEADDCARNWNPEGYMATHPEVQLTPETSFMLFRAKEERKLAEGLAAGKIFRRCASTVGDKVEVTFNNHARYPLVTLGEPVERVYYMDKETYRAIPVMAEATPEDYAALGTLYESAEKGLTPVNFA